MFVPLIKSPTVLYIMLTFYSFETHFLNLNLQFSSIACLWCPALPSQEIFQVGPEDWPLSLERSPSATTDRPRGLVKPGSGLKLHLHKTILFKSNKKLENEVINFSQEFLSSDYRTSW